MTTLPKRLCRLCAKKDAYYVNVFGDIGKGRMLEEKINICLPIKVKADDILPKQICFECLDNVETAFDLYAGCMLAEVTIKQKLGIKEIQKSVQSSNSKKNVSARSTIRLNNAGAASDMNAGPSDYDPVVKIVNATGYIRCVYCHKDILIGD